MPTTSRPAPFDVDPDTWARRNASGQPIGNPLEAAPAARRPGGGVLRGMSCALEPLRAGHAADLFDATRSGGDEQWTYLPGEPWCSVEQAAAELAAHVDRPDLVPYAVIVGGRARGMASLLRLDLTAATIEVGYVLFGEGVRRATPATETISLLARYVFSECGFRRVEWKCDALNAGSRAAATRFGFTFEGVWRQATYYKGRNRDTAWYAMTDADWRRLAPAYEQWLDAAVDASGVVPPRLGDLTAAALTD